MAAAAAAAGHVGSGMIAPRAVARGGSVKLCTVVLSRVGQGVLNGFVLWYWEGEVRMYLWRLPTVFWGACLGSVR